MRPLLLVLALGLAMVGGLPGAHAASRHSARPLPTVVTWFGNLHPAVSQRETVYVQFFQGKQYFRGARLSATFRLGKHVTDARGTTTNRRGMASATFTIPAWARGKVLRVFTILSYHNRQYSGNNAVKVSA